MKAMILAGGEGTRLRPLTCDLPKPMVPIANRPCMEHIINLLKRHGITQIGVTLAYLPQMISDYFGTGEAFGVNLKYFTEEVPLGTAGCIGNAREFLQDSADFLVISGDALTDIDLTAAIRFHREKNAMATLLLKQVDVPLEYGVVVTEPDGRILRFVEKPSWNQVVSDRVNTGIYILSTKILSYIKEGEKLDFAKDIFPQLMKEGQPMYGCVADGYWCDIGDLTAYARSNGDALNGTVQIELPGTPFSSDGDLQKVRMGNHCQIGKNISFTPPCLIGDHCIIGDGAHIGQYSILGNHTVIEANASLKKSILWDCTHIGSSAELRGALICQNTKVEARTRIFEHAIVGAACTVGADSYIRPQIKVWPGKEIVAGARLQADVVWDDDIKNASSHGLFGQRGIRGTYSASLTPEALCRLGSAFAAAIRPGAAFSVAHDGSATAGTAALSFLGGAASVGARCYDAGHQTLPILRYLVKEYGHQGAAFFQIEEKQLRIICLDANGCDISRKQEKKIERLHATCDLPSAPTDCIAPVSPLQNGRELYIAFLQRLLQKDKKPGKSIAIALAGAPFVREVAEQILQGSNIFTDKTTPDFSVTFSTDGEGFDLYDETGALVSQERISLLISFLLLERYGACHLALPVDQPTVHEWLSKQYGATLDRTGVSTQDLMERISAGTIRQQADAQLSMRYDAIYFVLHLALWLQQQNIPLSKLLQTIPHPAMAEEELDCAFQLKGRVMRKLAEENADSIRESADGIQIFTEKGWILILPDATRPVVRMTAEGYTEEFAKELLLDFERKINGYLQ